MKRKPRARNGTQVFAAELAGEARRRLTSESMLAGDGNSLYSRRGGQRDEFAPPDTVLQRHPLTFRVYQEMRDDPIVHAALQQRKFAALEPTWAVAQIGRAH